MLCIPPPCGEVHALASRDRMIQFPLEGREEGGRPGDLSHLPAQATFIIGLFYCQVRDIRAEFIEVIAGNEILTLLLLLLADQRSHTFRPDGNPFLIFLTHVVQEILQHRPQVGGGSLQRRKVGEAVGAKLRAVRSRIVAMHLNSTLYPFLVNTSNQRMPVLRRPQSQITSR